MFIRRLLGGHFLSHCAEPIVQTDIASNVARMKPSVCKRFPNSRGLTLVELLVSLAIGLLVLTAVLSFNINSLRTNRATLQNSRLNQELNGAMEMMVRDIRRAGYWGLSHSAIGNASIYTANPFISDLGGTNGGINTSTAGCILFRYDRDDDGSLADPSSERAGFRLSGGAVQMMTTASSTAHTCTGGTWESITDNKLSEVTGLTFVKTHTSFTASSGVVCTREIAITLTGRLVSDTSISQSLSQVVRVRADWYGSGTTCPSQ
jgi:prepilin peptidase dependent protein B